MKNLTRPQIAVLGYLISFVSAAIVASVLSIHPVTNALVGAILLGFMISVVWYWQDSDSIRHLYARFVAVILWQTSKGWRNLYHQYRQESLVNGDPVLSFDKWLENRI